VEQLDGGDSDMDEDDDPLQNEKDFSQQTSPRWDVIECRKHRIPIELTCRGHTMEYDDVDGEGRPGAGVFGVGPLSGGGFNMWDHASGREYSDDEALDIALLEEEEERERAMQGKLTRTPCVVRRVGEHEESEEEESCYSLPKLPKPRESGSPRGGKPTRRRTPSQERARSTPVPRGGASVDNLGRAIRGIKSLESRLGERDPRQQQQRRGRAIRQLRRAFTSLLRGEHALYLTTWKARVERDAQEKAYLAELDASGSGLRYPEYIAPQLAGGLGGLEKDMQRMIESVQSLAEAHRDLEEEKEEEEEEEGSLFPSPEVSALAQEQERHWEKRQQRRAEKNAAEAAEREATGPRCKWCEEEKDLREQRASQATQSPQWGTSSQGQAEEEEEEEEEEEVEEEGEGPKFPGLFSKMEELRECVTQVKRGIKQRRERAPVSAPGWQAQRVSTRAAGAVQSPSPLGSPKPVVVRVARTAGVCLYDDVHDTYDVNQAIPGARYPSGPQ